MHVDAPLRAFGTIRPPRDTLPRVPMDGSTAGRTPGRPAGEPSVRASYRGHAPRATWSPCAWRKTEPGSCTPSERDGTWACAPPSAGRMDRGGVRSDARPRRLPGGAPQQDRIRERSCVAQSGDRSPNADRSGRPRRRGMPRARRRIANRAERSGAWRDTVRGRGPIRTPCERHARDDPRHATVGGHPGRPTNAHGVKATVDG